jgi:hypothetical protein
MDNIKIQIIGNGVELTVGEITDLQSNYILSHQIESNKIIPLFNENFTLDYKNWFEVNDVCHLFGSTYKNASNILLTINGDTSVISDFSEERTSVNILGFKNYILSIKHIQGNILTYEFNVQNFDINKLTFLVEDLNSLLWGELIYGIKYDGVTQNNILSEINEVEFESMVFKNNTVMPIQKN